MDNILQQIIAQKQQEVLFEKNTTSIDYLVSLPYFNRAICSMKQSLKKQSIAIIAEFKRKSPSKGWIKADAQTEVIVPEYEHHGAAAVSILTDTSFFGGYIADIQTVRESVQLPLLRKEFIIDEYQLYQARAYGADAVLLIAAVLDKNQCKHLIRKAQELQLEVLLEIHNAKELEYISSEIDMVGINNRNLLSFETAINHSMQLIEQLPQSIIKVSESGIQSADTICQLKQLGFDAFLIGEYFMRSEQPGKQLSQLLHQVNRQLCL